jgi:7-cyano-7-deazaguanine synthase in queuosine biosynthesis
MGLIKNEAAVMFSGGIDSLLTSVLLQQTFDKVHLVTFDKGYLEFGIKNNLPNVERLKATYGEDRITHRVIELKSIIKRISVSSFFKDRKNYNTETRWCVGCRLSMNAAFCSPWRMISSGTPTDRTASKSLPKPI